jgi:hypothetical protein
MQADSQSKRPFHVIEPPPGHLERPYDPKMRVHGDFLRVDINVDIELRVVAEQVVRVFQSGCLG